jgi:hypothetical protein
MRRIDADRGDPLSTIRRLGTWKVDHARSAVVRTSADLRQAQQHADALAADARDLADWARRGTVPLQPVVHAHVVGGLGNLARRRQQAGADCDRCSDAVQGARDALALVQARQKALDRVAQRIAARMRSTEAGRLAREMDEHWLCSLGLGSDR